MLASKSMSSLNNLSNIIIFSGTYMTVGYNSISVNSYMSYPSLACSPTSYLKHASTQQGTSSPPPTLAFGATNGAPSYLYLLSTISVYPPPARYSQVTLHHHQILGRHQNFRKWFLMWLHQTDVLPLHEWIRIGHPRSLTPFTPQETSYISSRTQIDFLLIHGQVCRGGRIQPSS